MQSLPFIELPQFTRYVYGYMTEEADLGLQFYLIQHPKAALWLEVQAVAASCAGERKDRASVAVCE